MNLDLLKKKLTKLGYTVIVQLYKEDKFSVEFKGLRKPLFAVGVLAWGDDWMIHSGLPQMISEVKRLNK